MDLSSDIQELPQQFKFIKSQNDSDSLKPASSKSDNDFGTIDVNEITFENDETWLYKPPKCPENPIVDLNKWLQKDLGNVIEDDFIVNLSKTQNEFQKSIDSRTFTRPKKRFTRPSIEKYNEEVYGNGDAQNERNPSLNNMKKLNDSGNSVIQEVTELTPKPLNFDLSQPTNSYYFENVLANSAEIDSFQNMSPPSLVNSMCSSTFANLMDSSFIKNDPVLREIRDTDFTETVLLQDSEPPMFQSITESCSSISSDTPESFLKKISFNGTYRKNMSKEFDKTTLMDKFNNSSLDNSSYEKLKAKGSQLIDSLNISDVEIHEANNQSFANLNGTYRRSSKSNNTFRKTDVTNPPLILNSTFEISPNENSSDKNTTQTLIKDCSLKSFEGKKINTNSRTIINDDTVENMKKQLSETVQITDLNRLSYSLDDENTRLNSTYTEDNNDLNRKVNTQCSSLGCPTGSADSLDRMSSLSNSSTQSNKILNMADVDAIVEMQERSLQQVMSTPKPNTGTKKLWENNFISPISNEQLSDSDLSSNDEYKSVKSSISLENYSSSQSSRSLAYLGHNIDTKMKTNQRSTYTLASQKPLQIIPSNVRSSYTNLRTIQSSIPGSQSNLYKPNNAIRVPASATNLKTMGQKLKGSYTSLRPTISVNLPVAPPIISHLNTTTTLSRATNPNVTQNIDGHTKVLEVQPMPREKINVTGDNHFIKPQNPRASGLPRPTGIPRPASRIPGPRSNIRPVSSRATNIRRQTKDDYQ